MYFQKKKCLTADLVHFLFFLKLVFSHQLDIIREFQNNDLKELILYLTYSTEKKGVNSRIL